MHRIDAGFLDWASRYDDTSFTGRNLRRQREWFEARSAAILCLQSTAAQAVLAEKICAHLR
ncbi:hypothetical protein [Marimonas arenosa]|uniref:Uncharacterized protein n=1 Tax=Marimonas arenosa TaxID=1795305 RepID=A0AAE4B530_9RHOB|nr:hypothetical protein [Marimonas arenosa]MDQ2090727.1 hypothetical protein [Marimonas arenosa]